MYEFDKVYTFSGETRRVKGFDGAGNVITEPAPGEETAKSAEGADYRGLLALIPIDKCNVAELQNVAAFLGVKIIPPVEGKEPTKAEIIAQIGA